MKKLIGKLCILIIIVISCILGVNAVYRKLCYMDPKQYTEDYAKYYKVPDGIQICNFGSSHGVNSFDYTDFEGKYVTYNFALGSQTLSYDYRVLQSYEDHLAEGGVMFIPISYFSLESNEESDDDFSAKNERYYYFLKPEYIKQFDWKTYVKAKCFYVLFQDPGTIAKTIHNAFNPSDVQFNMGGPNYDYRSSAISAYERHSRWAPEGNLIIRNEELDALYGMVDICREHDIRPVLITTPFREEYNSLFSNEFYEQFYSAITTICEEKNVEYFDYSRDERFTNSSEYCKNADHLNRTGAVVFTDIIMQECGIY